MAFSLFGKKPEKKPEPEKKPDLLLHLLTHEGWNHVLVFTRTKVGADTVLAQIIRMVEQAQGAKLPIQALVDKVTGVFVPAVMTVAILG